MQLSHNPFATFGVLGFRLPNFELGSGQSPCCLEVLDSGILESV